MLLGSDGNMQTPKAQQPELLAEGQHQGHNARTRTHPCHPQACPGSCKAKKSTHMKDRARQQDLTATRLKSEQSNAAEPAPLSGCGTGAVCCSFLRRGQDSRNQRHSSMDALSDANAEQLCHYF